jgi:hypothetical protein
MVRLRRLLAGRGGSGEAVAGSSAASILDEYVGMAPSGQSAVDVFAGEWSSRLPVAGVTAGEIPLFEDERVEWALGHLGNVAGRTVLELGPLEGGHSSMLERAGALAVVARREDAGAGAPAGDQQGGVR